MHLVVIYGWKEESGDIAQAVAAAQGTTVFEARQRMIGGGPSVLASFADLQRAQALADSLTQNGVPTLVVDTDQVRNATGHFAVRRFELGASALSLEAVDGKKEEIEYGEIDLLLPGIRIDTQVETKTVTEKQFSLGRTILTGGIPVTKKVSHQEEVTSEERTKCLYLFAGNRPQVVFRQSGMAYDGLGAAMKMSQELNFNYLTSELRRLASNASYDDRLLNRLGQVRLLGLAQNVAGGLDLAAEILSRSLRR